TLDGAVDERPIGRRHAEDPDSRRQLLESRLIGVAQMCWVAGYHIERPAALGGEIRELLPAERTRRLAGREVIADQQEPVTVRGRGGLEERLRVLRMPLLHCLTPLAIIAPTLASGRVRAGASRM